MAYANQRLGRLKAWFDGLDRRRSAVLAASLILLIVLADDATGWRLRFTMFYILPAWIAAWKLGLAPGLALAGAGAVIGSIVNAGETFQASVAHIPFWMWDVGARFVPVAVVVWLVDRLRGSLESERRLARTDALTGALNRRALIEEAGRAMAQSQRLGLATGFIYLDLDGFKAVNDQHGHAAGCALLVKFVVAARAKLRHGDLVARVGGDEFVLLLVETRSQDAEQAARRACGELRELMRAGQPPVSFCAGLCLVDDERVHDPALALLEADRMLNAAKQSDREIGWFQVSHFVAAPELVRVAEIVEPASALPDPTRRRGSQTPDA